MPPHHHQHAKVKQPVRDATLGEPRVTDIHSDLRSVLEELVKLGAPLITLDELKQLRRESPSLVQNLALIAERLRGRDGSKNVRAQIERVRHAKTQRHLLAEIDPTWSECNKADYHLKAARRTAADQQKALDEQFADLLASQRELDDLKYELGRRRRALLLLETLKKKEEIRITRMKELDLLLQRLRGAQSTENAVYHPADPLVSSNPTSSQGKSSPNSLTRDTLTQLHIYHSTHSRIAQSLVTYEARSVQDQQRRLQESIANALHVTVDDDRVVEWCAKLSAEAERRAHTKLAYRRPPPSTVVPHNPIQSESMHSIQSSVEDIIARLHEKEQNIQQLANGVTALGQGCLSHIDIISKAIHGTALELRSSLQTQAQSSSHAIVMPSPASAANTSTQAYINRLVEDILRSQGLFRNASSTKGESKRETVAKLEAVLGVKGRKQIVSRVEEMLERDYRTRTFASRITLPFPSSNSIDPSDRYQLINATNNAVLTAQTTATDLLRVKLKQAEDVEGMVKEVRRLRRDVRAFVDSI